ncbi:MAG: NAD-dependent epimerase/dehydratase family protein [Candidatus Dormibacteria bacterium]
MKVLLTGGAGFIGSHIGDHLLAGGHQVVVVDDLSRGQESQVPSGAEFYRLSISDLWLHRVFERERPDAVIHQAAQIDVRRSVANPAQDAQVNILGTINLVEAAGRVGVSRFLFAGTGGAVYGDTANLPTPETEPALPESPYGIAKLACEHYLRVLAPLRNMTWMSLRYANVYGPRQDPHGEAGVVAIFAERLLRGQEAVIFGDGEQSRDFVYVGDVARANLLALRSSTSGAVNIGTGAETSVNQLFEGLRRAAGVEASPRHAEGKPGEQRRSVVDPGLALRELGWAPEVSLEKGLALTLDFFRERAPVAAGSPIPS